MTHTKRDAHRVHAWLLCLAMLVGLLPSGKAFAADSETTFAIVYEKANGDKESIGTASLSLTGTTLTYAASIAQPGYEMTRFQLAMGGKTADIAPTGAQRTSLTGAFTDVAYDDIKAYAMTIGVSKSETVSQTKTFYSAKDAFPGAKEIALQSTYDSWNELIWTVRPSAIAQTPNAYFAAAGARWVWNREDSNTQGGNERCAFTGSFDLPTGIAVTSARLAIAADNAYAIDVNGTLFTQPPSKFFTTDLTGPTRGYTYNFGDVMDWSWAFENVDLHDLKAAMHGGANAFTIYAFNACPNPGAYNPGGVIYRLDVAYDQTVATPSRTPFSKTGTLPQPPAQNCALAIALKLVRINGAPVASTATAQPGDVLTFELSMTNTGDVAVKPGAIAVRVPQGLTASAADNPSPWSVSGSTMTYLHPRSIAKGGVDRSEFILRVPTGANGPQTIDASAPTLVRPDNTAATNPTPNASATVPVDGGTSPIYGLRITHTLVKVNDAAVPAHYAARPGDKLTFTMSMRNVGNRPVRPGTVDVRYSSGLYAQGGDNANPPWTLGTGRLVYAHDGSAIAVGAQRDVDYVLRVRSDCPAGNQTIDTYVPTIVDDTGADRGNTTPDGSATVPVAPWNPGTSDCALRITHRLVKINDTAVQGTGTIRPGDKLTYTMTMTNIGSVPVRPGSISVMLSKGLYAQQADNANPPWTVTGANALTYAHDGGLIAVNGKRDVDYVVRVATDCAVGNQTIETTALNLYDASGAIVANRTPTDAFVVPVAASDAAYGVVTKFWLAYVNGKATGWTYDNAMPSTINIMPGDVLTYLLRTSNLGGATVYPSEYAVSLPSNQTFDASENPGWVQRDGNLVYAYGGAIEPGKSIEVPLKLRVKKGTTRTIAITLTISPIKGSDGSSTNGGSTTLNIPVLYGEFADMAQTGENPLSLLPVLCGALLLLGGGGSLFLTRRRGKRAAAR